MKHCIDCSIKITGKVIARNTIKRCIPCQTEHNKKSSLQAYRRGLEDIDIAECPGGTPAPYQCYYGDVDAAVEIIKKGGVP